MFKRFNFILVILFFSVFAACSKGKSSGNEPPATTPVITLDDLSLFEGNSGTTTFNVVVKLSASSAKEVTVQYTLKAGTAKEVSDFTAAVNQTLRFAAGETQKHIAIAVVADDIREGDEDLVVELAVPVGATLGRQTANVIIRNDDSKVPFTNTGYDAPSSYAGYSLIWADEFNETTLNNSNWTNQNGDGCDINLCGWGNNELEFYTNRSENLFFQDGKLIIEARKENYQTRQYTSSKLISSGKRKFKYGRIDFRAKMPAGKGIWPAFWMLPQDNKYGGWPTSGELDIMEYLGHEQNRTHGTVHYGPGPGSTHVSKNTTTTGANLHQEFHVYSIEWKEDEIKWLLDGNVFATFSKTDVQAGMIYPFNEDFYFIINLAVGGNWPGAPDASTLFPQWLIVDYVRVYQLD